MPEMKMGIFLYTIVRQIIIKNITVLLLFTHYFYC